jgi:hypothetical protein
MAREGGLFATENARPKAEHEQPLCEECGRPACLAFGPPGLANLHAPRRWFCGVHRAEGIAAWKEMGGRPVRRRVTLDDL